MGKNPDKLINIVIVTTIILVGIFGFLNLNSKPRINAVEIIGETDGAEFDDQRIILHFSRPMNKVGINDALLIEPNTEFETYWSGNDLYIKFPNNLKSESNYKLIVSENVKDIYGSTLEAAFEYNFHTRGLSFYYLLKGEGGAKDSIFLKPLNGESQLIYEDMGIKKFVANENFIVVDLAETDDIDKLILVNIATNQKTHLDWGITRIGDIEFNPKKNEFIALVETLEKRNNQLARIEGPLITKYNIDQAQKTVLNPDNTADYVSDVHYSPDGENLLYFSSEYYYVTNLNDPSQTAPIDKFAHSGGFNKKGDKLIFLQYDQSGSFLPNPKIVVMNSDKELNYITDGLNADIDIMLFPFQNKLTYAQQYTIEKPYIPKSRIIITDFDESMDQTIGFEGDSLNLPLVSPDERYLIMERYTSAQLKDSVDQRFDAFIARPYKGYLVIYDIVNNKILDEQVEGINAVWL